MYRAEVSLTEFWNKVSLKKSLLLRFNWTVVERNVTRYFYWCFWLLQVFWMLEEGDGWFVRWLGFCSWFLTMLDFCVSLQGLWELGCSYGLKGGSEVIVLCIEALRTQVMLTDDGIFMRLLVFSGEAFFCVVQKNSPFLCMFGLLL